MHSTPNYSFTVTANQSLVANFTLITYNITASASPSGSGTIIGEGTVNCGANVTLVAKANPCYTFVNWTEGGTVVSTFSSYTFTASANETLVANFVLNNYIISTSSSPPAGGITAGGGSVSCGSSATVTATTNLGYYFVNWMESGNVVGTTTAYTFTVTSNHNLVANFGIIPIPPNIVTEPQNQSVVQGANVSFVVAASGTPSLAYQWLFNGTNLVNNAQITGSQSNVLSIASVTVTNSGTYEVVVTNVYGSTNASATLTVSLSTLQYTANPTNGAASPGSTVRRAKH